MFIIINSKPYNILNIATIKKVAVDTEFGIKYTMKNGSSFTEIFETDLLRDARWATVKSLLVGAE